VELLAASITEVFEMFQDFAVLVEQQHEQIRSIESTVCHASMFVAVVVCTLCVCVCVLDCIFFM